MFGIGMTELVLILLISMVVFGAKRLPEIGAGLGKGIKNFKNSLSDAEKELKAVGPEALDKTDTEKVENKS